MAILEPAMFLGLGSVAIWLHVRFPRLHPSSIMRAIVHVGVSFGLFWFLPNGVDLCAKLGSLGLPVFVVGMMIPTLGYVFLSWVWLMAKLKDLLDSTPRGGHRVRSAES